MNTPPALYGAMNKERKPFTYTPGGLDLSEIKSERMAKRLMRNAMSEGVSEAPAQTLKSPPVTPGSIPNFNCLPVQVFPTFQLPANPKSLLKTRSNSNAPKEIPSSNISPASTITNKYANDSWREINKLSSEFSNNNTNSNYKPTAVFDYNRTTSGTTTIPSSYGSCSQTNVLLPEKCYDAKYYQSEPQGIIKEIGIKSNGSEEKTPRYDSFQDNSNILLKNATDNEINPVSSVIQLTSAPLEDVATNNYEQKQVKVVKKQTNTDNESEQNGDTEAAVVIKLPTKTSAAKTETKVEVLKKVLPDGTIEEVKKTITKTTKDGKTEISTRTETRTIPKEIADEEVEVEEEEEEVEDVEVNDTEDIVEVSKEDTESKGTESKENGGEIEEQSEDELVSEKTKTEVKENGHIITGEEKLESSTTKKVVVIQSTGEESEEEIEEEVEEEEQEEDGDVEVEEVVIIKKPPSKQSEENEDVEDNAEVEESVETKEEEPDQQEKEIEQEEEIEEEEEEEKEEIEESVSNESVKVEKEIEASDEQEQVNEKKVEEKEINEVTSEVQSEKKESNEESYEESEDREMKDETKDTNSIIPTVEETQIKIKVESEEENKIKDKVNVSQDLLAETIKTKDETKKQEIEEEIIHKTIIPEPRVSFREPSIPFEKVEDIEIKPIGPAQEIIKKSHTEIITTTTDKPTGALSTQTEYNRIENFVTVNRTTKTLDHAYEQTQQTIPTLKTYFSPITDRVLASPQPISKPYQPVYTPEPPTERRHSLLLERLSVDRQVPTSDIYQNNYQSSQSYEQNQWSEEPQSEVLTVSNVKPSTITKNQQWYQQNVKENVTSNTTNIPHTPAPVLPSQIWNQQNQAPSYNQIPTQPQYQTHTQQQYTPKPEFQSTYVENNSQNIYKSNTNNAQSNIYPTYTPKPSWVSSTFDTKPTPNTTSNQYSSLKKESTENYQTSTQQFNSSYVPPPWEQDSSYITENQNYYQPPPTASYTPNINQNNQSWKPKPPPGKFSKPTPTAYIPPAPNQSFVKPVTADDTSKITGRKTYYSEYERRYISVPESTYIPNETKLSAQPDPSPQYYYDNNEPTEFVEPQWRKELREFTEKASQTTTQTESASVRPPWEEDPKYNNNTSNEYSANVTPSWTQTLRPRSWRERSYEPEYAGSKEWPKTNTLGRGRPQSSYVKSNINTIQERPRGVSVDRYNPNNYQPPLASEHPPVQSHTLNPTIHPKTYHNPSVPAYHGRASAEPREQTTAYPKQRMRVDTRAPPVQSRSFKYLQWITGTED